MMNDPIVVWPPGTFVGCDFQMNGHYEDCSMEHPELVGNGSMVCCLVG